MNKERFGLVPLTQEVALDSITRVRERLYRRLTPEQKALFEEYRGLVLGSFERPEQDLVEVEYYKKFLETAQSSGISRGLIDKFRLNLLTELITVEFPKAKRPNREEPGLTVESRHFVVKGAVAF